MVLKSVSLRPKAVLLTPMQDVMCLARTLASQFIPQTSFMRTIKYHLERRNVYLMIATYIGNSTKQMTRSSRSGNDASREHQLSLHATLPTQKVALNVVHKVRLIDLICHYLINHIKDNQTKLVITGKDPTPVHVWNNFILQREDLRTNHDGADRTLLEMRQEQVLTGAST